jgi:hypothetical protein
MFEQSSIASSVVPITLIGTGSIFALSFYNRLLGIIDRLRTLDSELLASTNGDVIRSKHSQILMLNKNAFVMKFSLLSILIAAMLTLTSGLIIVLDVDVAIASILYTISLCFMITSIALAAADISIALLPVMKDEKNTLSRIALNPPI